MTQYYNYIKIDPYTLIPRYVGKGKGNRHQLSHSYNKTYMGWLKNLKINGLEPITEIINVTCENTAFRLEQFLINQYGRKDLGTGSLLNHTNGGEGISGYRHTEETKKNQSKKMMGNKNCLGRRQKEETKEKIRKAHIGKKNLALSERNRIHCGENSYSFGKPGWSAGKKRPEHSKFMKENNPKYWLGKKNLKLSEKMKGHSRNLGTHYKVEIVTCPYCEKSGALNNMTRYHFDNCKHKKTGI